MKNLLTAICILPSTYLILEAVMYVFTGVSWLPFGRNVVLAILAFLGMAMGNVINES